MEQQKILAGIKVHLTGTGKRPLAEGGSSGQAFPGDNIF